MDPFSWIGVLVLLAIATGAIYEIVYHSYLTWSVLKDWSKGKHATSKERIATYKARLKNGRNAIIAGVFDKKTERVVGKLKAFSYDDASKKVIKRHRGGKVRIWN